MELLKNNYNSLLIKTTVKKIVLRLSYFIMYVRLKIFPAKYPVNTENKIYIHLGCGEVNSPEFINVDSRPFAHIHHVSNVTKLHFFKDGFADLIYASHILEHLRMSELETILLEWKRVLKKGGLLRLGVPDFDTILKIYSDNNNLIESVWRPLLGGQDYPENFHFAVFNKEYLSELLLKVGFTKVREWDPNNVDHHNFDDWTSIDYVVNKKVYKISLNIEAIN